MIGWVLPAAVLLSAEPARADETPFEPAARSFADAASCAAHLGAVVADAGAQGHEAVRGPYAIAEGDIRIHMVRAEGSGHRIREHRCLGKALSGRTWHHSMASAGEAFTVDSIARKAEWLKQRAPQQQQ